MNSEYCNTQRAIIQNFSKSEEFIRKMKYLSNKENHNEDIERVQIVFNYNSKVYKQRLVDKYKTNNTKIIKDKNIKRTDPLLAYIERRIKTNKNNLDKLFFILDEIEDQMKSFIGTGREFDRYVTLSDKCITCIEKLVFEKEVA